MGQVRLTDDNQPFHIEQSMSSLHTTTALLGLGLALAIMWLLRRDHLHVVHGVFWLVVAALAALLGIWPGLIDRLAVLAGVSYPPALLFLAAAMVLLIRALHADILNTRMEEGVQNFV